LSGEGAYWDVFTINGITGDIDVIDRIVDSEPGGRFKSGPAKTPGEKFVPNRNLVSWTWDFGDGAGSDVQNPSHTYASEGSYTVSLIVNDGLNNKNMTKFEYIHVGPTGIGESELRDQVSIYPVPAADVLHIRSGVFMSSVQIMDVSGRLQYSANPESFDYDLNIRALQEGIYFIRLITENGVIVMKFLIKR
jgi:hypothetical protein